MGDERSIYYKVYGRYNFLLKSEMPYHMVVDWAWTYSAVWQNDAVYGKIIPGFEDLVALFFTGFVLAELLMDRTEPVSLWCELSSLSEPETTKSFKESSSESAFTFYQPIFQQKCS